MTEKNGRNNERKNLVLYLTVYFQKNDEIMGRCVDLSGSGLMIVTREVFDMKKPLKVRLALPEQRGFQEAFLPLTLELKWKKPDVNPEYSCYGASFGKLTAKGKSVIDRLAEITSFSNNKKISQMFDTSSYVVDIEEP